MPKPKFRIPLPLIDTMEGYHDEMESYQQSRDDELLADLDEFFAGITEDSPTAKADALRDFHFEDKDPDGDFLRG